MGSSLLIHRRLSSHYRNFHRIALLSLYLSPQNPKCRCFSSLSSLENIDNPKPITPTPTTTTSNQPKPSSLSARMGFVLDQIDAIEKERSQKDETLHRIRTWRESKDQISKEKADENAALANGSELNEAAEKERVRGLMGRVVELVHPWPEWIELMERLVQQNYFDYRRKDEDKMIEDLGFTMSEVTDEGFDFTRDWNTVQTAFLNFGNDRFDILRRLSRQDIQVLVGYGCPSVDKKVVFSAKLLRKHVHLDEGDVCSSCSLRSSCERGFLLTNKEDEARTVDIMRVLLTYGFNPVNGSVGNESVLKIKSVKTVVRKLLHQVVRLSAVPIDPNLPRPVIMKPPPKVKQPPPPPKKRVGRDDIEMKKGDWLCPKCDFMNFAKNSVCLQCDANRPKRQLLPGEWECPECNFLNYRRNVVCFHCECKRPPDEFTENQMQGRQQGIRTEKVEKIFSRKDSWNFDFDDNESDGADVAAFEYADSHKLNEDFPQGGLTEAENSRSEEGFHQNNRPSRIHEREYSSHGAKLPGTGFDDFDDEEDDLESYELDTQTTNQVQRRSSVDFSDLEVDSDGDQTKGMDDDWNAPRGSGSPKNIKASRPMRRPTSFSGSEVDNVLDSDSDREIPIHRKWKSSHVADSRQRTRGRRVMSFDSDEDIGHISDSEDDEKLRSRQNNRNQRGSGRRDFGRKARRGSEDFSASESDDEDIRLHSSKRSTRTSSDRRRNGSKGCSGFDISENSGYRSHGMMDDRKSPSHNKFGRSSRGNDRGFHGDEYDAPRKGAGEGKFRSPTRDDLGNQRRGRSNKFDNQSRGSTDSFLEGDRFTRPRNNVR